MRPSRARTVSHASELGRWEMSYGNPDERLRPHVRDYQVFTEITPVPRPRRAVPSPWVSIIVHLGEELVLRDPDTPGVARRNTFVAGLHRSWSEYTSPAESHGIEFRLSPIGAHLVTGIPAREMTGRVLELDDVFGGGGAELVSRLRDGDAAERRFDLLDDFLRARLDAAREPAAEVEWAWRELVRTAGRAPIGDLASNAGWSRKRLIRGFDEHVGVSPKTAARILRFSHAHDILRSGTRMPLASVAAECGYSDQPHMTREFAELSGATPSEFRRRLIPDGGGVAA